jgi:hypothetical protein
VDLKTLLDYTTIRANKNNAVIARRALELGKFAIISQNEPEVLMAKRFSG